VTDGAPEVSTARVSSRRQPLSRCHRVHGACGALPPPAAQSSREQQRWATAPPHRTGHADFQHPAHRHASSHSTREELMAYPQRGQQPLAPRFAVRPSSQRSRETRTGREASGPQPSASQSVMERLVKRLLPSLLETPRWRLQSVEVTDKGLRRVVVVSSLSGRRPRTREGGVDKRRAVEPWSRPFIRP
jgi:hypothetical protein